MGGLVHKGGSTGVGAFSSSTNVQHSIITYMSARTTQHSTAEQSTVQQSTDVSNVLA